MYLMSLESAQDSGMEINVSAEKTPAEELEFSELRSRLKKSLSDLPDTDQRVISLFFDQDLSQKEIASKLKLSRSKVNRIIGKTVVFLREKLK